jgi:hypothetical protein
LAIGTFPAPKLLIFLDYHQFLIRIGGDPLRYLLLPALPERYR